MKKPEIINTGRIHAECADLRHQWWQKNYALLEIQVDWFAKMKFSQEGKPDEHMWVLIHVVHSQQEFSGVLANDPQFLTNIKDGDPVRFKREQIEWIEKPGRH